MKPLKPRVLYNISRQQLQHIRQGEDVTVGMPAKFNTDEINEDIYVHNTIFKQKKSDLTSCNRILKG